MQADKEKINRLLKTARGQIDGLLKMVEEDRYCIDISTQLMAAESVLRKANREILKAHLEHCVMGAIRAGDPGEEKQKIDEIVQVIAKLT